MVAGRLPPPPRAPVGDCLRVVGSALGWTIAASMRRLVRRRRRPAWSLKLEGTIAAHRGAWSTMPAIGIVRWRNVGEALTPVKTDGLTPRYVAHDGPDGSVKGAWFESPDATDGVLLYFHGGGFCFGSLRTHGQLIGALARATRARTFALDYRLAPEHPAPAAIDDALAAYRSLLAQGISPDRIVLAGDSAGGTMVLSTLLALRDNRDALPVAGVALSPWVDLGCSGGSFQRNAAFDVVGDVLCRLAAATYLAGADPRRPDRSPLFADLAGLPPLLLQAGEAEVLVDQIRVFARQAADACVEVRLHVYEDMVHVWHLQPDATPEAQRAIDEIGAFVQARVGRAGCVQAREAMKRAPASGRRHGLRRGWSIR
jgi:epsilon-lactone hydrolase